MRVDGPDPERERSRSVGIDIRFQTIYHRVGSNSPQYHYYYSQLLIPFDPGAPVLNLC